MSVCCGHYQPDEWDEQLHVRDHIACLLDEAEFHLCVQAASGNWAETIVYGPAVWVVPGGVSYRMANLGRCDLVTLFCEPTFVRAILGADSAKFVVIPLAQFSSRDEIAGRLFATFRPICRGARKPLDIYVESIGTILATHVLDDLFCPVAAAPAGLPAEKVARIVRYIDDHLADELDLAVLARVCSTSTSHFSRLFKRSFNATPHEFVMRRRVSKAEQLLQTTEEKEIDIALCCGFSDDTLMARWFRRVLGRLPKEVRARR